MAEGADSSSVNPAKRRPTAARKSRASRKTPGSRVSLEKVLGISTASGSGLTSDPNTGLIAYPAGCVIVLLHPKKNKQSHIINTSRKPFSALAFSHDGKHLVTGESGHMPRVRVWEVDGGQVAEVQSHKYGVSCVAFSSNSSYIVSVGYQHDMTVSVWDWRKGSVIASNKVSSRVLSVSFSQDNSYFVTAGNRHVKFWYLDASKERRVNSTVPLIGRSALLRDHMNSIFSGVVCGRGRMASSTYCITSSGLLCLFNSSRHLEAWVNLKTSSASCLVVSEDFIFCGCADGVIRVFSPSHLQYITTLHRPHRLGVDLSQGTKHGLLPASPGAQYPDTVALTFDSAAKLLTCVYNDHSLYVWDVKDVRNAGKLYSALYHSSSVWSVEVYPELFDASQARLPPSSFFTCSSDNTIRLWQTDAPAGRMNNYSNDLLRILYVGENTQHLQAEGERGESAAADPKTGIRVLGISPDGRHLAAGDRCGNLHVFGVDFLDELVKIEAHDGELLCLAFSPASTGVKLLATASRDRLIHIFNLENSYSLEQTLNDHSAAITAVKFAGESPEIQMVSCGTDKSIYFQTAEKGAEGLVFSRSHHVVEKTTLYDMDLDPSGTHVAIACQDRNVRVYDVKTGKLKKCLKGSSGDEGALLKVHMDPSGSFFATSCSDKNIAIFDYDSGERVATLFGHSEIVTCMRFSQDCRHLITVAGDSCVFVWRLDSQMTSIMRKRRGLKPTAAPKTCRRTHENIRRETFITVPSSQLCPMEEEEEADLKTPAKPEPTQNPPLLQTNGKLPMWFRRLQCQGEASAAVQSGAEPRPARNRWAEQLDPLIICSNFSSGRMEEDEEEEEDFHPQSLESLMGEEEEEDEEEEEEKEVTSVPQVPGEDRSSYILYPDTIEADREFEVEGVADPRRSPTRLQVSDGEAKPAWSSQLSPDSACSEGSAGSLEQQQDADTDSLSQTSSVGSSCLEDEEDRDSLKNHFDALASALNDEKFDTDLRTLQPPEEKHFLNPRLSISARFLSRFQDRIRAFPGGAPPPVSVPTRISEESNISSTTENSESSSDVVSNESTRTENGGARRERSVPHRRLSSVNSPPDCRRPTLRRRHTVVVVQCKEMLKDVTSSTVAAHNCSVAPAVQQGAFRLGYRGTTASSRAKLSQDPPTSTQEEEKENLSSSSILHGTEPAPHQDQISSVAPSPQKPQHHTPPILQAPATPTEGGVRQSSVSSVEKTPTNQNQMLIPSPAPSTTQRSAFTACDIISGSASTQERPAGPETRIQTEPGDAEETVSLLQCQQVAGELRRTARRAVQLYRKLSVSVDASERHLQMLSVLQEAFDAVNPELQAGSGLGSGAPSGPLDDDRTISLLEKYSEQLVQMTRNKLNQM